MSPTFSALETSRNLHREVLSYVANVAAGAGVCCPLLQNRMTATYWTALVSLNVHCCDVS